MAERAFIAKAHKHGYRTKDILLFDHPVPLRPLLSPRGWQILRAFCTGPRYPAEVARELGLYRQKVYYNVRQLVRAGLLQAVKEEQIQGGIAKFYQVASPAFGVEMPYGEERIPSLQKMDPLLQRFWSPIIEGGELRGKIVVGSPEPHGPNRTTARDGHYAIHLGLFLGQFCSFPGQFAVKLDVDVKSEKEERSHMILIGGPGTNLLSADINRHLPVRFDERNYWAGLSDAHGSTFSGDRDALIAKIPNPFDETKRIIMLAGNRHVGTKAAIIAVTSQWREVLPKYAGKDPWAAVVRGFDLDGDGKVDSVETLS